MLPPRLECLTLDIVEAQLPRILCGFLGFVREAASKRIGLREVKLLLKRSTAAKQVRDIEHSLSYLWTDEKSDRHISDWGEYDKSTAEQLAEQQQRDPPIPEEVQRLREVLAPAGIRLIAEYGQLPLLEPFRL